MESPDIFSEQAAIGEARESSQLACGPSGLTTLQFAGLQAVALAAPSQTLGAPLTV